MNRFKKFAQIAAIILVVVSIIFISYDYYQFKQRFNQDSVNKVNGVVNDILQLNANLRQKITELFIKHQKLIQKVTEEPENEKAYEQLDKLFKQHLESYYTFIVADNHGELITDDFFEKAGHLCRQDIKNYAASGKATWMAIHPGMGEYHYDLIIPWQYGDGERKIIFISFKVNSLVNIIRKYESEGHRIYIVRKDKSNLIELTAEGSRDNNSDNILFLSDKQTQGTSARIAGTYWTAIELVYPNMFSLYLKQELFKTFFSD